MYVNELEYLQVLYCFMQKNHQEHLQTSVLMAILK